MTLRHTLTAVCDYPSCGAIYDLDPNTTQPYRDLSEVGWTNDAGTTLTCPRHAKADL